eukprot:213822-Heterocapsa_arctica.AAC.1
MKGTGKGKGKTKGKDASSFFDGFCKRRGRWGHKQSNCTAAIHLVQEYAASLPVTDEEEKEYYSSEQYEVPYHDENDVDAPYYDEDASDIG